MEEERVRKLKTEVEIRRMDYEGDLKEMLDFQRKSQEMKLAEIGPIEFVQWYVQAGDVIGSVAEKSRLLIESYTKYVEALEGLIPKPDWETP